jgi:immunoglobulin-like protein involved in spore germination
MTDEHRDDEVLGRALSRAIETQNPSETPYERSRVVSKQQTRRGGFWTLTAVAAAVLLAVALGTLFTRSGRTFPAAASPTPATPTQTSRATSGPIAVVPNQDRMWVYFVRDALPPVGMFVNGTATTPSSDPRYTRIGDRINTLRSQPPTMPAGLTNPIALIAPPAASGQTTFGLGLRIDADVVNVEIDAPTGWGVHGAAQVQALVQQLIYVTTEEPGIRKARITEKGKTNAVIDGLIVDRALSREDVTDYDQPGRTKPAQGFGDGSASGARKLTTSYHVSNMDSALARFVIDTDLQSVSPTQLYPDFKVEVLPNDELNSAIRGKWRMRVSVNGVDSTTAQQTIDQSPLRTLSVTACQGCSGVGTIYDLGLDDLRPWRTAIEFNPFRIIVDIGGDPRTIAGDNAVYTPAYGATVPRTFSVSGVEHNFEAHVDIRVKDERDREILKTVATGTNCCDPGGTFAATVNVPASASGRIYLEVYQASPKDGSDTVLIRIPLTVR